MLDQGARAANRGTSGAFQFDSIAQELSLDIINDKKWFFEKYLPVERLVILMPLLHAENLALQELGFALSQRLAEGVKIPSTVDYLASCPIFFNEHLYVIERFSRFPTRNLALVSCVLVPWFVYSEPK